MASDWTTLPFREYLNQPLSNGIYKTKEFHGAGAKVVNMGELFANPRLSDVPMKRVALTEKEASRSLIAKGDLLFARRSLTAAGAGKCSIVIEVTEPTTFESSIIRARPNPSKADSLFLYYLFSSPLGTELMRSILRQVAVSGVTSSDLSGLIVTAPPVTEQKRISAILDLLDRRVESLAASNLVLEGLARTIFKSWFVDFDLVRAKAEGREPEGMDAATAALFPSEFEDSGLGRIPEGWSVSTVGHNAWVIDCLHSKKPNRIDSGRPFLQLCNIANNGLLDLSDTYHISDEDYEKWTSRLEAAQGDCVITNVGRVGAVAQIPSGIKAALGRNMTGIRCQGYFLYPTFLIELLTSAAMRDEIALKTDSGTILDSLNVRSIPSLRFVHPCDALLNLFEQLCRPLRHRMELSVTQIRTLSMLRDALLPRLISGKLRVPEAEKMVEAVL